MPSNNNNIPTAPPKQQECKRDDVDGGAGGEDQQLLLEQMQAEPKQIQAEPQILAEPKQQECKRDDATIAQLQTTQSESPSSDNYNSCKRKATVANERPVKRLRSVAPFPARSVPLNQFLCSGNVFTSTPLIIDKQSAIFRQQLILQRIHLIDKEQHRLQQRIAEIQRNHKRHYDDVVPDREPSSTGFHVHEPTDQELLYTMQGHPMPDEAPSSNDPTRYVPRPGDDPTNAFPVSTVSAHQYTHFENVFGQFGSSDSERELDNDNDSESERVEGSGGGSSVNHCNYSNPMKVACSDTAPIAKETPILHTIDEMTVAMRENIVCTQGLDPTTTSLLLSCAKCLVFYQNADAAMGRRVLNVLAVVVMVVIPLARVANQAAPRQ